MPKGHFVGKQLEFLSGTGQNSSQFSWSSKGHLTFAQIEQHGLTHLLLCSCSQWTHCTCLLQSCYISNCCNSTKPDAFITKLFLHFICWCQSISHKHIYCSSPKQAAHCNTVKQLTVTLPTTSLQSIPPAPLFSHWAASQLWQSCSLTHFTSWQMEDQAIQRLNKGNSKGNSSKTSCIYMQELERVQQQIKAKEMLAFMQHHAHRDIPIAFSFICLSSCTAPIQGAMTYWNRLKKYKIH